MEHLLRSVQLQPHSHLPSKRQITTASFKDPVSLVEEGLLTTTGLLFTITVMELDHQLRLTRLRGIRLNIQNVLTILTNTKLRKVATSLNLKIRQVLIMSDKTIRIIKITIINLTTNSLPLLVALDVEAEVVLAGGEEASLMSTARMEWQTRPPIMATARNTLRLRTTLTREIVACLTTVKKGVGMLVVVSRKGLTTTNIAITRVGVTTKTITT